MAAKFGILIIHGMGSQSPGYSDPLVDELSRRLGDAAGDVVWQEIYWADAIADRERQLWDCMREAVEPNGRSIRLDWQPVREFIVHNFGDAVAYQRDGRSENTYAAIHRRVSGAIAALKGRLPSPDAPLVILAHSLGAHIMSNYIWDRQTPAREARSPIRDPESSIHDSENSIRRRESGCPNPPDPLENVPGLCSFITFGCSIALFSLAFPVARPISLPGPAIEEPLRAEARWLNFLDRDDVLGWPIRPLYAKNDEALESWQRETIERIEDCEITAGGLLKGWNPASHGGYWTAGDFTRPVAAHLRRLLTAIG